MDHALTRIVVLQIKCNGIIGQEYQLRKVGLPDAYHFSPAAPTTRQEGLVALARLPGIERPPSTNLWSTRLSAHALHELVAEGYWPQDEATPSELGHPLLISDLEDAADKTDIALPQGRSASKAVSRSSFAIWLMRVYLAHHKISME